MPKTPPDRLAAALRANLKRRKGGPLLPPDTPSKPDKDPLTYKEKAEPPRPAKA